MGETYPGLDGCKPPGAGKHPTAADDGMFLERHRGPGDGESFVVIEILLNLDDLAPLQLRERGERICGRRIARLSTIGGVGQDLAGHGWRSTGRRSGER